MISTAGDLVTFALRASGINGIGQQPSSEDANTGLQFLGSLLAQWQRKRWLVPDLGEVTCSSTGTDPYTIGPAQQFNCPRPDRIESAFARLLTGQPNQLDIPLYIIDAREDYIQIPFKTVVSMPAALWYDSAYPIGYVHFYPIPVSGQYELHLNIKSALPVITALTDLIALPPEYTEALIWSLCVRLQMAYGMPARPDHIAAARQALNAIRQANTQIGELAVPVPAGGGTSDWTSFVGRGLGRAFVLGQGEVL
jgi:hypothetical protein